MPNRIAVFQAIHRHLSETGDTTSTNALMTALLKASMGSGESANQAADTLTLMRVAFAAGRQYQLEHSSV